MDGHFVPPSVVVGLRAATAARRGRRYSRAEAAATAGKLLRTGPEPGSILADTFCKNRTLSRMDMYPFWRTLSATPFPTASYGGSASSQQTYPPCRKQAPPSPAPKPSPRRSQLLVLSARSEPALERSLADLAAHLEEHPELELADMAFTLAQGRGRFPYGAAVVCKDTADAVAALQQRPIKQLEDRPPGSLVFMFPGQGEQYAGRPETPGGDRVVGLSISSTSTSTGTCRNRPTWSCSLPGRSSPRISPSPPSSGSRPPSRVCGSSSTTIRAT